MMCGFPLTCVIPFSYFAFYAFVQKYAGSTLAMYCVSAVWHVLEILNLMGETCNLKDNVKQGMHCNYRLFSHARLDPGPRDELSRGLMGQTEDTSGEGSEYREPLLFESLLCYTSLLQKTYIGTSFAYRKKFEEDFQFTKTGEKLSVGFAVKPLQRQCAPWGRPRRALSWEPHSASSVQLPEL